MTIRERIKAALSYEPYDKLPVLHFGYWGETLEIWANEGHIPMELAKTWGDGNASDRALDEIMGWDQNYSLLASLYNSSLYPCFEEKVIKEFSDGSKHIRGGDGVTLLQKPEAGSIPAEIEHILVDRKSWEEHYLPKLQWNENRRIEHELASAVIDPNRETWISLHVGSLLGTIRNWIGVVELSYMQMDDPDLLKEIVDTYANLQIKCMEENLKITSNYDDISIWEDICYNHGPLVNPKVFDELTAKHYKKISEIAHSYGINFVHVDCDGLVDSLVPTWINNGVNIMYPIEVGTWDASYAKHRAIYGKKILGVGGMDKKVFAYDKAAVDAEIERLKPIVDLGGYIPCPDHRIAPDAKFENVMYYIEKMKATF